MLKQWIFLCSVLCAACTGTINSRTVDKQSAKFEPPENTVLVFAGQQNLALGGHDKYKDGYIDHIGIPAGISSYCGFLENVTTPFGFKFDVGRIEGLNSWDYWGSGPVCLKCMLDDPDFANTIVHLGISLEFDSEVEAAKGNRDNNIEELAEFLKTYAHIPFFLRMGFEFDGDWNGYEPEAYKKTWRRTVDYLRSESISNFAMVFASSSQYINKATWQRYYPGDEYVDWLGYSWWNNESGKDERNPNVVAHELAREWGKPIFMSEVAPKNLRVGKDSSEKVWDWYQSLFDHIEANADTIKALAIITDNWDAEPMWADGTWGDSRIHNDKEIKKRWLQKMQDSRYIHGTTGTYELIGFTAND